MRRYVDALLAVVFAPPCAACRHPLERPTEGPVCRRCWNSILPLTPPLCDVCGDPLPTWRSPGQPEGRPRPKPEPEGRPLPKPAPEGSPLPEPRCCVRCQSEPRIVTRARAIGAYEGPLRAIIHALKYDGRRTLARPLAALMRSRGADVLAGADLVVPVPLHPSRRRVRGFNQAHDLARHLGCPTSAVLRRIRATPPQADLPAAERLANVRQAFEAAPASNGLAGRLVVLVDDVCTTGATLDACAFELKRVGVREVRALTAARVPSAPR